MLRAHIPPASTPPPPAQINKIKGKKPSPHTCRETYRTQAPGIGKALGGLQRGEPGQGLPAGRGPEGQSTPRPPRGRGWGYPRSPLTSCSPRWTRRGRSGPRYSSPAAARRGSWTPSSFCPLLQLPAAPARRREMEAGVPPAPQAPGKCSPRPPRPSRQPCGRPSAALGTGALSARGGMPAVSCQPQLATRGAGGRARSWLWREGDQLTNLSRLLP